MRKFLLVGQETQQSLLRAIAWLERAQDAETSGGVPAFYLPFRGWSAPYPETTGYIIPTFLAVADWLPQSQLRDRALRMGEWLLNLQYSDGAFPGGVWRPGTKERESVFNSGQILFGLIALWKSTGEDRWRDAGHRCTHWLSKNQDSDGAWRRFAYRETHHVYKTRVAWALAASGTHWNDPTALEAAARNVGNAISFQNENGWFDNASFDADNPPVLHTFAYTLQGILETGLLLGRQDFVTSAVLSSKAMADVQSSDGSLPGKVGKDYSPEGFRCLTGIAQQVIVWGRLHQIGNTERPWQTHSAAALAYLRSAQVNKPGSANDGGFAGSRPLWGPYMRFRYPNWAVKFYIDAVLADAQVMDGEAWG